MARRSLQASDDGILAIKKALKRNKWSQTLFAGRLNCSRQTIWSLLHGKAVDFDTFMQACGELGLNWEEIAQPEVLEPEISETDHIAALVQAARAKAHPQILDQCGTMRVLDMTQPIALTGEQGIYTNVNILEKLTGRQRLELPELLNQCDAGEFERFGLSSTTEKRVPGLDAAQAYPKMMVLGKPGAGKTTFLKYLAMQCIEGNFLSDHLPILVTLKAFAEDEQRLSLLESIGGDSVTPILAAGKALILLDGLDEVREEDTKRVIRQIEQLSEQYPGNHFVITCRIAAKEYTFGQFTEVEVADFNDEQVDIFAHNWFRVKGDIERAKLFRAKLDQSEPIKELASSPLLLTLLCWIFGEKGDLPKKRHKLYQEGMELLLDHWDKTRLVERDQVYKNLSLKQRKNLLSKIALHQFERQEYFFEPEAVEILIASFLRRLENDFDIEADSKAVLRSIESHHGLLIERAKGIYSFSHLTFHEYFAAREILESRDPEVLSRFVKKITEKSWREVFLLTASMMRNADELLMLMKQEIDGLLAVDDRLQEFLSWVHQKSASVDAPYKPAAVRAFYLTHALDRDINDALVIDRTLNCALIRAVSRTSNRALNRTLNIDIEIDDALADALVNALDIDIALVSAFDRDIANVLGIDINIDIIRALGPELQSELKQLRNQLPNTSLENRQDFRQWWESNGQAWTEQLRVVMIEHRDIGHNWQFSEEQKQLLQQYHDANKLLVDCLNSDCYVSREARDEIEETLLLPLTAL